MTERKKKATKKESTPAPRRTQVIWPAKLLIQVDVAFIAEHMPKFKARDMVVIAMALGATIKVNDVIDWQLEFVIHDSKTEQEVADV